MEIKTQEHTLFSKNIVYCTTLYLAAQNGHRDIVKYISELPIDIVGRGLTEFTQLFLSAQRGKYDSVKRAIEDMFPDIEGNSDDTSEDEADKEDDVPSKTGCNTIHDAAEVGAVSLMRSFISITGKDVNAKNDKGLTALQVAAQNGKSKCVEILIKEGATVNYKIKSKGNNDKVNNGKTSLHLACEHGHFHCASKLLSYGADPEVKDWFENVPLYYAVKQGSKRIVQLLLNCGVDINILNNREHMVITEACNENVTNLLLQNGLDYRHISRGQRTSILHHAIYYDNYFLVNFLLENKVKINIEFKDKFGDSPLAYAAYFNKCNSIKVLLKYGANIHSINNYGENALHICARLGSTEASQLLLENGIDINATTIKSKQTSLILAVKKNKVDIVKSLLSHDPDLTVKDSENKNALDYAIANKNQEIIQMLKTDKK